MKKISIFIGSSIEQFREERMDLENFIHRLSNIFIDRYQVQLVPNVCEAQDTAMVAGRKQDEFNKLAQESDLCLFLFYTRAGEATLEEFHKAVERFMDGGKPKIYVYFKNIHGDVQAEQSLKDFINEVDGKYKHYYGTFDHVDTLKLRILLALKYEEMDFLSVEINGDKCCVDGEDLSKDMLDLSKVNEFFNSEDLKNLLAHYNELNAEYERLLPIYKSGEGDAEFYKKYAKLCTERDQVGKDIDELRKNTFALSLSLSKALASGEMSARMAAAYRLLEKGNKQGCIDLLTDKQFKNDYYAQRARDQEQINKAQEFTRKMQEIVKKRSIDYITALRLAISTLKTMYSKKDRFVVIDELYKEAVTLAEEDNVELDVLYDYANYLYNQNQYQAAISYAQKLRGLYKGTKETDSGKVLDLYNLLGLLYDAKQRNKEAEKYYVQALEICKRSGFANSITGVINITTIYNNLGALYNSTHRYTEAEKCYTEALKIRIRLAGANSAACAAYAPSLVSVYNNLGLLYNYTHRYTEAEKCHAQALEISKRLAAVNPEAYDSELASCFTNFGLTYSNMHRYTEAEKCYTKALEKYKKLATINSAAYDPKLALGYSNLGSLYINIRRYAEAEDYSKKALEIRERLTAMNSKVYEPDLATSNYDLGMLYLRMQRYKEAEDFLKKALKIFKRLAEVNLAYEYKVALSYNALVGVYWGFRLLNKAEEYCLKAYDIFGRLIKNSVALYGLDLVECYYYLGMIYNITYCIDEAEDIYGKTIELCRHILTECDSLEDLSRAKIYYYLGCALFGKIGESYYEAGQSYIKAMEICENHANSESDQYELLLAQVYNNLGELVGKVATCAEFQEEYYYLKAMNIYERYVKIAPSFELSSVLPLTNLIAFYDDMNQSEQCLHYALKAADIYERHIPCGMTAFKSLLAFAYYNISICYWNLEKIDLAKEYILKVMPQLKQCKDRLSEECQDLAESCKEALKKLNM